MILFFFKDGPLKRAELGAERKRKTACGFIDRCYDWRRWKECVPQVLAAHVSLWGPQHPPPPHQPPPPPSSLLTDELFCHWTKAAASQAWKQEKKKRRRWGVGPKEIRGVLERKWGRRGGVNCQLLCSEAGRVKRGENLPLHILIIFLTCCRYWCSLFSEALQTFVVVFFCCGTFIAKSLRFNAFAIKGFTAQPSLIHKWCSED